MANADVSTSAVRDRTIDFAAGTMAGVAGLVVGHPFDTVKVRFQSPRMAKKYKSTFHALVTIIREERFLGLYKGITTPLATCALMNGLVFASYRFLVKVQGNDVPTIAQVGLAGIGSGIVSSVVTTPTELIKIRQQSLLTETTAWAVTRQIFQQSGVRGLYRGLPVTALRDCGYGAYFASYELSCRCFSSTPSFGSSSTASTANPAPESLSWLVLLISGGVAGVAGWVATFPLDVVKTRIQGSETYPRSRPTLPSPYADLLPSPTNRPDSTPSLYTNRYRTILSTITNSYNEEGMRVFYRGLAPTLIRAIPVNMVTFATFHATVLLLS